MILLHKSKTNKPKVYIHEWLTEPSIINGEYKLKKKIAEDIELEFYVGNSGYGKDTWAIAVICVTYKNSVFKMKYDSGRINNDLDKMVEECIDALHWNWDLDLWRRQAKREIETRSSIFYKLKKFFNL